jgi:hypothetical protein
LHSSPFPPNLTRPKTDREGPSRPSGFKNYIQRTAQTSHHPSCSTRTIPGYQHRLKNHLSRCRDRRLSAETQRLVSAVEGNKLRLEQGITIDLKSSTAVTLHTTEAGRVRLVDSRERDLATGDGSHVCGADGDGHVGEGSTAGVDKSTDLGIVLRALDLGIVRLGDVLVDEKKRSSGIGNRLGTSCVGHLDAADSELGGIELPETRGCIDGDPGHVTNKLGRVDFAELVHARAIRIEVGGEDGEIEVGHYVVEEGLLGGLLDAIVDCWFS